MTIELWVIWSAIVWRVTALLVYDNIMAWFRSLIGIRYDEHSNAYGLNIVAQLFLCHKCTSIWVAALVMLLVFKLPIEGFIAGTLALSTGSIIINKWVNGE